MISFPVSPPPLFGLFLIQPTPTRRILDFEIIDRSYFRIFQHIVSPVHFHKLLSIFFDLFWRGAIRMVLLHHASVGVFQFCGRRTKRNPEHFIKIDCALLWCAHYGSLRSASERGTVDRMSTNSMSPMGGESTSFCCSWCDTILMSVGRQNCWANERSSNSFNQQTTCHDFTSSSSKSKQIQS